MTFVTGGSVSGKAVLSSEFLDTIKNGYNYGFDKNNRRGVKHKLSSRKKMSKKGKAQRVKDTAICYNNIAKMVAKGEKLAERARKAEAATGKHKK